MCSVFVCPNGNAAAAWGFVHSCGRDVSMRKGTFAARALTVLLSIGMLSQNVVTVYAAEDGSEPTESSVTITYVADEHGSVSLTEETVTTLEEIQGSTATADEGYEFSAWKDTNGNEVGTAASFTPSELPTEDVTYTAYFSEKEEEPEEPVVPAENETNTANIEAEVTDPSQVPMPIDDDATTVEAGKALLNGTVYDTLEAAVNAAVSGDTITLGTGKYTLYNKGAQTKGKNLTFVGQGTETEWGIGATIPDPSKFGTEYNGDYSFDGAGTITFKSMTLQSGTADYLGFIRADNTVVEDCTINGKTFYWGYTSATFKNTTFNAPSGDYAVWTYSSPTMTFDGCTFNTSGKVINVYRDYAGAAYTINYKDCTVNNSGYAFKQVMNINDSYPAGQSYTINISGNNEIKGDYYPVDRYTCSRLYGFGNKSGNNAKHTVVNIEGNTVFQNGELTDHEQNISGGSYSNGVATNSNYAYSEGYKDDAYSYEFGYDYQTGQGKFYKVCDYCGYEEEVDMEGLAADMLIDGNTEHDAVVKVSKGQTFDMTGELYVSGIKAQIAAVQKAFPRYSYSVEDINCKFTAVLTVPDGISIPSKPTLTTSGLKDVFEIDGGTVSKDGKSITVVFSLTQDTLNNIKTFDDLKNAVDSVDDILGVTVKGVKVNSDVPVNKNLTMTGIVTGSFTGTAYRENLVASIGVTPDFSKPGFTGLKFSFDWTAKQTDAGRDAILDDGDDTISLTVIVLDDSTPDPAEPDEPHDGGYGDITLYKVDAQTNKPLAGAKIALYKSNGDYVGTYTTGSNGEIEIKNAAYSTYYFQEMQAPDGYVLDNTHQNLVLDKDHPNVTIKFTNAKANVATVLVGGTKTWVNDSEATRPASITLHLYANGVEVGTATTTAEQNWVYSFGAQAVSDANGATITYTMTEDAVANYTTAVAAPVQGDGTLVINVTNTYNGVAATTDGGTVDSTHATITTGDDSNMALYGMLFAVAAAALVAWTRKSRVR